MREADRAKQFLPFNGLRGYVEMIGEAHREREARRDLSEARAARLNEEIGEMEKGDYVRVVRYDRDHYTECEGEVEQIDFVYRKLTVGGTRIRFSDLWKVERI